MIKVIAIILRGWWWLYYGAWNAGEFIVCNPGWLTRHAFQMLIFVNAPAVVELIAGPVGATSDTDLVGQMAQLLMSLTPIIFAIDKVVITTLIVVWLVHMVLTAFVIGHHDE